MTVHETSKLYSFFDNQGQIVCEVVASTYDDAYEKAVTVAGSRLPFRPEYAIEVVEEGDLREPSES